MSLIEDEALIRMGTSAMLEDAGYGVLEAADAQEAQQVLASHPEISIVVTDVQMPGAMDGLALVELLKQTLPHIQVLVTSGRSEAREAGAHGAARFLPKPYTAAELQKAVGGFALP